MTFNSLQFLIFFPIVAIVHFLLPYRFRWILLLGASCYFYMAFIPIYLLFVFIVIVIDYAAGILLEKSEGGIRKVILWLTVFATCSILFVFKYFNFFNVNLSGLAAALHWNYSIKNLSLVLPIGISFYTFQSLSYVIEVYRKKCKAEHHFGIYALYVLFFPQLVAGPIERPGNLLPQFFKKCNFDYCRVTNGLKLMMWGMFQKVVIADRLAIVVNSVYNNPADYQGLSLIVATIFFAFQIYCDFAGYSDIAIGAAEVLGFKLMKNFNSPYFAASIAEFWKRWHISLSTWFRDYVYLPLGGKKCTQSRWIFNIMITFMISGLWHGANWTFVVWGGLHGFFYVFSIWTKNFREKIARASGINNLPIFHRCIKIVITFCLVLFSWIFFRSNSIQDSFYIISHLFTGWDQPLSFVPSHEVLMGLTRQEFLLRQQNITLPEPAAIINIGLTGPEFVLSAGLIMFLLVVQRLQQSCDSFRVSFSRRPLWVRWPVYIGLTLCIMNLGITRMVPFIYFQF